MTIQGLLIFLLIVVWVIAITWYVTQDTRKRGFKEFQVLLLTLASVLFFPIGFVLYLILRPSPGNASK
jgi:hypothetical protein